MRHLVEQLHRRFCWLLATELNDRGTRSATGSLVFPSEEPGDLHRQDLEVGERRDGLYQRHEWPLLVRPLPRGGRRLSTSGAPARGPIAGRASPAGSHRGTECRRASSALITGAAAAPVPPARTWSDTPAPRREPIIIHNKLVSIFFSRKNILCFLNCD